jgi:penicillin-binding protein 1A
MASKRKKSFGRKEPVFGPSSEERLDTSDRPASNGLSSKSSGKDGKGERKKRARRRANSVIGRAAYWALVLALWFVVAGIGTIAYVGAHLPPIQSLEIPKRPPSILILDLNGRPLARRGDLAGTPLALESMPKYVPQAFVAIEDRRFYDHYGVDPIGILRAAMANVLHLGVAQGGSTITQQLAKNLFLTQERTVIRKLQEMALALWLEHKFSKMQILELYLNRVYFGAGAYGIEQASQRYFNKSAKNLALAEAAMLAGLVKSPARLAPTRDFNAAEQRAALVLAAMSNMQFITTASERSAFAHPPHVVTQANNGSVNYAADWIMDAINDVMGHVEEDIVVRTTIDSELQANAEKALDDELAQKGTKANVSQSALVAMTPNGAVRALIGGRHYSESQFNRAIAAKRQPGSAFKPFVYLTALEGGLTPESVREDAIIKVKNWQPENYGHQYFGPVTLTKALALSLNTVAVRLAVEFGPQAVIRTAHRLGIVSKLEPNVSIALGTSEVSLLEMVRAYAPFANGGYIVMPHVIDRITNVHGKTLYSDHAQRYERVIDARHIGMMNAMMEETLTIGTARQASLPGWSAAGKTGTSQDFRDAWFIGYTPRLVTGVWLGNDDGTPTRHVTGGSLPAEIWNKFMRSAHEGVPIANLPGTPSTGGLLSTLFGSRSTFSEAHSSDDFASPTPPAPIRSAADVRNTHTGSTLDGWLLNSFFGR